MAGLLPGGSPASHAELEGVDLYTPRGGNRSTATMPPRAATAAVQQWAARGAARCAEQPASSRAPNPWEGVVLLVGVVSYAHAHRLKNREVCRCMCGPIQLQTIADHRLVGDSPGPPHRDRRSDPSAPRPRRCSGCAL